ncbi:uncharacterized protein EV420DRAFT_1695574 [Desarmillaria tabescens]|uniref:F-box domain-containing protein n=1 Tax=Armillaria tabescens TaxID=1929756 RepID=A0AA39K4F4_ARMTA|nr:uncharacterized protein EV420DRAFT_1695574 [Desarmillaria tabescens]KAK0454167.1 hypothetical protein EV420DRAFT_1695574 [Desarmillaria tabescens]
MHIKKTLDSLNPHHSPWSISHISQRWQTITLACPMLWSHIALDLDQYETGFSDGLYMFRVGLYLKRPRECDLSISLWSNYCVSEHSVLGLLKATIPQWTDLTINLCPESIKYLTKNSFPVLQRFEINSLIKRKNIFNYHILEIKSYMLQNFAFSTQSTTQCHHCVRVLRQLTSAKRLILRVHKMNNLGLMDRAIIMPCVERLEFKEKKCEGSMARLFNALRLPSLTFLSLMFTKASRSTFPTRFEGSATLMSLHINCDLGHSDNTKLLLRFLTLTPHIMLLRLSTTIIPDDMLCGLTLAEGKKKNSLLLSLHTLEIAPSIPECDVKMFIRMPESRYESGSPGDCRRLERLQFEQPGEFALLDLEDQERWETLCRSLDVFYVF